MTGTFTNFNAFFNSKFPIFFSNNVSKNVSSNLGSIIDSGATQHMTGLNSNLKNTFDVSDLNMTVGYPNGTLAKITKIGNLKLSNNIVLIDVLVIPEYCVSLLSVHKLSRDSNMFVGFDQLTCYIQYLGLKKVVGTGIQKGGLY